MRRFVMKSFETELELLESSLIRVRLQQIPIVQL